jgi:hypothetical protein
MFKLTRRSSRKSQVALPAGVARSGSPDGAALDGTSRRAFIGGTGAAAAGAVVMIATPKVASLALSSPGSSVPVDPPGVPTTATGPAPFEPVTAYVRNADSGEVTVMSGQHETTYNDPALVKRLLDAAH